MNREQLIRQIVERAVVNAREAIENQSLDRELVSRACAMQLAAFKLEPRPVIFYSNLPTAAARVRELAKNSAWRDAAWLDAAWRDAAWLDAALLDAAWLDAALLDAAWRDASLISARARLDMRRGGLYIRWIARDAIHAVLARIRIDKPLGQGSRLHYDSAPAIQYEDGSGLFFWHGIRVPEQVITSPQTLEVNQVLGERNAEVRRAMIERYGLDRFVLDAGARTLNRWNDNELLVIDLPEDPDQRLVALKLRCPSTSAVYIIRVPPNQKTVRGALAWSFGLDRAEDYVLQKES